ncbi:MAG: hypothetical protein UZ04_CHB001001653 [Chlorobi bacterium OLB4]|nr:MAG: hypothetical protein UZ04_CHB001001653 [Chlorobi bacterium OLB4]
MQDKVARTHNKVFMKWGLTCYVSTFVQAQIVVLRMNHYANNPPLHKYPNRYAQC